MEELKHRRVLQKGEMILTGKGYYSYRNYVMAISRLKVAHIIFPRNNFALKRLLGMFSYPLEIFFSRSCEKLMFVKLAREFTTLIKEWERFKPVEELNW